METLNLSIFDHNNIKSSYGFNNRFKDVTGILRKVISTNLNNNINTFNFKVNNKNLHGDPFPNKVKKLIIKYKHHQKEETVEIKENNNIIINIIYPENIIFKKDIDKLKKEFNYYNISKIFGKGPTFKIIPKEENELRGAINQASNMIDGVDIICMNDRHNIYKINNSVYKRLKYLIIPEYLHIDQKFSKDGHFLKILDYLKDKFNGKIIVYNLLTSPKKNDLYISMETAISSANNLFEFISKYTNIKDINTYGIGINTKDNYHKLFTGNGTYDNTSIDRILKNLNIIKKKCDINLNIY